MNTKSCHPSQEQLFGKRIASHLSHGSQQLTQDITERLRASRTRAIASRQDKTFEWANADVLLLESNGSLKSPFSSKAHGFYSLIVSLIPLICLAAGLMLLYEFHNDQTAMELAEIDFALLVDDLPPHAYTDPAFVDFLKNHTSQRD